MIIQVNVDGVQRYARPLLQWTPITSLYAPKEDVISSLRSTECRLAQAPSQADSCCYKIHKLEQAGYIVKISLKEAGQTEESWFIPHHMVQHNGKNRIVFNCSLQYHGRLLNDQLLPRP